MHYGQGAKGYLLKGMSEDELPDALERVLKGQASLPPNLVSRLIDEFRDRERFRVNLPGDRAVLLTPREWDVLGLMRSGSTTAEIAERLFISATTVRSHVSAILRKLEVSDRSAAISLVEADQTPGVVLLLPDAAPLLDGVWLDARRFSGRHLSGAGQGDGCHDVVIGTENVQCLSFACKSIACFGDGAHSAAVERPEIRDIEHDRRLGRRQNRLSDGAGHPRIEFPDQPHDETVFAAFSMDGEGHTGQPVAVPVPFEQHLRPDAASEFDGAGPPVMIQPAWPTLSVRRSSSHFAPRPAAGDCSQTNRRDLPRKSPK